MSAEYHVTCKNSVYLLSFSAAKPLRGDGQQTGQPAAERQSLSGREHRVSCRGTVHFSAFPPPRLWCLFIERLQPFLQELVISSSSHPLSAAAPPSSQSPEPNTDEDDVLPDVEIPPPMEIQERISCPPLTNVGCANSANCDDASANRVCLHFISYLFRSSVVSAEIDSTNLHKITLFESKHDIAKVI